MTRFRAYWTRTTMNSLVDPVSTQKTSATNKPSRPRTRSSFETFNEVKPVHHARLALSRTARSQAVLSKTARSLHLQKHLKMFRPHFLNRCLLGSKISQNKSQLKCPRVFYPILPATTLGPSSSATCPHLNINN